MWDALVRLWRGEVLLRTAFWEYAIVYGLVLNAVATAAALTSHALGAPVALTAALFLSPIPYSVLFTVGVWRSASRYAGQQLWADLARIGVAIWAVCAAFI